jgi:hypothetical protein
MTLSNLSPFDVLISVSFSQNESSEIQLYGVLLLLKIIN